MDRLGGAEYRVSRLPAIHPILLAYLPVKTVPDQRTTTSEPAPGVADFLLTGDLDEIFRGVAH